MDVPVKFKKVKKYIREAKKLAKSQPTSSYYVWLHAVSLAMQIDGKSPEGKAFCVGLLDEVETSKKTLGKGSKEDHMKEMQRLALAVFKKADDDHKAGTAGKKTAQMFSTAFVLMDCISENTKENPDAEIETKRKYALAMTAHILTCLKNGEPIGELPGLKKDNDEDMNDGAPSSIPSAPGPAEVKSNDDFNPGPQLDEFGLPIVGDDMPAPAPQQPLAPVAPVAPVAPAPAAVPTYSPPISAMPKTDTFSDNFEKRILACAKAEHTMKAAFNSVKVKDCDDILRVLHVVVNEILQPFRGNGRWRPAQMSTACYSNKDQACIEATEQMREAHCAMRFEDVDCAIAILSQVMTVLTNHSSAR